MTRRSLATPIRVRRGHKYRAKPVVVDGIRFASTAEAKRYGELRMLEKAGKIRRLELQPSYPLHAPSGVGQVKVGKYVGDFAYWEREAFVIEDVKGIRTPLYKWKKKHFEAEYGVTIVEVTR